MPHAFRRRHFAYFYFYFIFTMLMLISSRRTFIDNFSDYHLLSLQIITFRALYFFAKYFTPLSFISLRPPHFSIDMFSSHFSRDAIIIIAITDSFGTQTLLHFMLRADIETIYAIFASLFHTLLTRLRGLHALDCL